MAVEQEDPRFAAFERFDAAYGQYLDNEAMRYTPQARALLQAWANSADHLKNWLDSQDKVIAPPKVKQGHLPGGADVGVMNQRNAKNHVQPLPSWGFLVEWGRSHGLPVDDIPVHPGDQQVPGGGNSANPKDDLVAQAIAARVFSKLKAKQQQQQQQ